MVLVVSLIITIIICTIKINIYILLKSRKEVLCIAITTAFVLNVFITRRVQQLRVSLLKIKYLTKIN